jgi:eukaryotic-like serine/threonine-protein kinase
MQDFGKVPKNPEKQSAKPIYSFGPFLLNSQKRILFRGDEPVALTPKALEILLALVSSRGEVLTKDELIEMVWPDTAVEEGNLNRNISTLRKALGELPDDHQFIVTVPGKGYRFVADVRELPDGRQHKVEIPGDGRAASPVQDFSNTAASAHSLSISSAAAATQADRYRAVDSEKRGRLFWTVIAGVALLLAAATAAFLKFGHRGPALSETDTILIADFANSTGDSVFDDTLKQATMVQLGQSPYLNILPDFKIRSTLKLMTMPAGSKLTPTVARDLCQRAGAKAYITGSVASLGSLYVIGLEAINCQTGESLAREQNTAMTKELTLQAIGQATTSLRKKLGESLNSIQKFDTPLAEATTPSLDALKAFSEGIKDSKTDDASGVPFFKRAIELDSDFASAYESLAVSYHNLGEIGLARENFTKAFELRDRVSEREKFVISARYYEYVTGDLHKAIETYQLWVQAYPRSAAAHANLAGLYGSMGQYERSIPETLESIRLEPDSGSHYSNLVLTYAALERYDDARKTYDEALSHGVTDPVMRTNWFGVLFVKGDRAEMNRLMQWSVGKPQAEDNFLAAKSDTEAYVGHLEKARELSQQAVSSAVRGDQKETAAEWKLDEAVTELEFGNPDLARREAAAALAISSNHDSQILAALAFARAGDAAQAQKIVGDLTKNYPSDTLLNDYWLPVIRASMELKRNNPVKAVEDVQVAVPYELASPQTWPGLGGPLYPAYIRGESFLLMRQGVDAAKEFQVILNHQGFMMACPLGVLARLQLARAYAEQGDKDQAGAAYKAFFEIWKDADPNIPVLKQARAEFARLQ